MNEQDQTRATNRPTRAQFDAEATLEHIPDASAYQAGFIPKSEIALQELLEGCIDQHTLTTVLSSIEEVLQYKIEHIDDCWQDKALAKRWDKTRRAVSKATGMAHAYGL